MKIFKKALRVWFALASVLSFLGGWILLAHAPKPIQPVTVRSATTLNLPPIQAFGSTDNGGLSFFNGANQPSSFGSRTRSSTPLLMTGGS